MKTRRLAPVALAIAVLLGATGCTFITPQETDKIAYIADGVVVPASGPLKVRNALLVADESGTSANFLAAIVNDTDKAETLTVGLDAATETVRVPARSVVSLGFDRAKPILFSDLDAKPGTDVEMSFHSGDGESVVFSVPVLDGTLSYLKDFVPAR